MDKLVKNSILSDPEFLEAKRKIKEVAHAHSTMLTKIQEPLGPFTQTYADTIRLFNAYRGQDLFYPFLGSGRGNGALVELADGSVKYDFISGIGAHFGHCHPKLIDAALDAAVQNINMQGHLIQNTEAFYLTDLLVKQSGLSHCILTTSGAMANENALKLIFHKKRGTRRLLAFDKCFMGRTLTLAQITDAPAYRVGLPQTVAVDYLPFYDWKDPKGSTERAITILKKQLKRYPKEYACLCVEMVQGEAGNYPGKQEFFLSILKIAKEENLSILFDEIQTFGRGDHLFAYQSFGLTEWAEVVSVGKLLQTCATLYKSEFTPEPGLISQTFTSSTGSLFAGTAIVNSLLNDGFLGKEGKNMQLRKKMVERLQKLESKFPDRLEGPFGWGLMVAFTPFKGHKENTYAFAKALFKAGVIVFVAGQNPTRIRLLIPAGGVTFEDIDAVMDIIEEQISTWKM